MSSAAGAGAWTPIGTAADADVGLTSFNAIAADPSNPYVVFVSGDIGPTNNGGDAFRGDAATGTWTSVAQANASARPLTPTPGPWASIPMAISWSRTTVASIDWSTRMGTRPRPCRAPGPRSMATSR